MTDELTVVSRATGTNGSRVSTVENVAVIEATRFGRTILGRAVIIVGLVLLAGACADEGAQSAVSAAARGDEGSDGGGGGVPDLDAPEVREAVEAFAACMAENGVEIPVAVDGDAAAAAIAEMGDVADEASATCDPILDDFFAGAQAPAAGSGSGEKIILTEELQTCLADQGFDAPLDDLDFKIPVDDPEFSAALETCKTMSGDGE